MAANPDILKLIPQRPPFVMIGSLIASDGLSASTTLLVDAENVLVTNGYLSEAGLIENIAQTAAAKAGYEALQNNEPVKTGYIGAIKNLQVFVLPTVGDLVETEITVDNQIFDVTLITGRVKCRGELLAQCEMKIFIQPTIDAS